MEQVLQNINRLNRNLESIISVRPSYVVQFLYRLIDDRRANARRSGMSLARSRLYGRSLRILWGGRRKKGRTLRRRLARRKAGMMSRKGRGTVREDVVHHFFLKLCLHVHRFR